MVIYDIPHFESLFNALINKNRFLFVVLLMQSVA